ncbi:hypothetical protein D7W79_07500 [Corallococcus exercitus]|nr:hypothetical protein D7W79_07500 [Corallococcus exercitus]
MISTLWLTTSLLLTLPTAALAADDAATRKKLVACINKDITAANAEWKLPDADLKKFTDIIDREVMKGPLASKTPEQQMKVIKEIQDASRKELPSLDNKTLDKMIDTLQVKAKHCNSLTTN